MKRFSVFFKYLFLLQVLYVQAQNNEEVSIYLAWTHQFQFAGYYAAIEKGFFEKEGIQVTLHETDGDYSFEGVLSGKYDYGITTGGQILATHRRDQLGIIAPIFQQSPIVMVTHKKDSITRLQDLEGKKVAVGKELKAMMHMAGVDLEAVSFKRTRTDPMLLDSSVYSAVSHYVIDGLSTSKYRLFRPIEYGINFYGECLYTSKNEMDNHPERVAGIKRAVVAGWNYAVENPQEVIDWILTKYNPALSREYLEEEAELVIQSQVLPAFYPIGFNDIDRWKHMDQTLNQFMKPRPEIDWNTFVFDIDNKEYGRSYDKLLQYILIGGLIALGLLIVLVAYNLQLKRAVRNRTMDLTESKGEIESVNQQLTDQKQELEDLHVFKDRMFSVISHDIKGPVQSVYGIIDLIANDQMPMDRLPEMANKSKVRLQEVNTFIDNILYWARLQIQGIQVQKERLSVAELVDSTLSFLAYPAEQKGILLEQKMEKDLHISADRETISLVLRNLLSNAIKFCSEGDKVAVEGLRESAMVKIQVTDTGPGIDRERAEQIFSSGVKSTPGSDKELGHGLGLQLCKDFVEQNGGQIGVFSELGKGSMFWFTIPVATS